jgi:hypothetical protein
MTIFRRIFLYTLAHERRSRAMLRLFDIHFT